MTRKKVNDPATNRRTSDSSSSSRGAGARLSHISRAVRLSNQELKLTAALYAKTGVLEHVRKTGRLPRRIHAGGLQTVMRLLIKRRGPDITLTPDEKLVYDAIFKEGSLPAGSVRLVKEIKKALAAKTSRARPPYDSFTPLGFFRSKRGIDRSLFLTSLCKVHGWQFESTKVWVLYGLRLLSNEPFPGFIKAKKASFPNAGTFVLGGCLVSGNDPLLRAVSVCPECQVREADWRAEAEERFGKNPAAREGRSSHGGATKRVRDARATLQRELPRLRARVAELKGTNKSHERTKK